MTTSVLRYERLAEELAGLIEQGVLRPGERLPSVRKLAEERRLSVSTVVQGLRCLEQQGLVEARPQSGFFVRARALERPAPQARSLPETAVPVDLNQRLVQVLRAAAAPGVVPLGGAWPDASLLPIAALHRLYGGVVRRHPDLLAAGSHSEMNESALVRQIVRRSLAWGGPLAAEELVVTNSCTEALALCLRAVTQPGDTVAVESPTYYLMLQLIESLGLKALEIPTDHRHGLSVDALELASRVGRVAAILVVPNANNPLGCIMPDDQKKRLVRLAAERHIPIIEDDIYGDIHFSRERPWPLKAYDRDGNVMLCSSFSKCLSPALRLGFVAAGRYQAQVVLQKTIHSGNTNPVTQTVVAEYLASGSYDRHLRTLRQAYWRQVEQMMAAVTRYFPGETRLASPQGGFVLWVELPEDIDANRLHDRAMAEKIAFIPGPLFSASGLYRNCLRLNCGNPWTFEIEDAVRRLGQLMG